jgi:hypothetical protein
MKDLASMPSDHTRFPLSGATAVVSAALLSQRKLTFADLKAPKAKPPGAAPAKAVPAKPKGPAKQPLTPGSINSRRRAACAAANARLRERWPAAFNDKRKPLAVGIHKAIFAEPDFDTAHVRLALNIWVRHAIYLRNLARGGRRFALDGSDAGEISEDNRKNTRAFAKGGAP